MQASCVKSSKISFFNFEAEVESQEIYFLTSQVERESTPVQVIHISRLKL